MRNVTPGQTGSWSGWLLASFSQVNAGFEWERRELLQQMASSNFLQLETPFIELSVTAIHRIGWAKVRVLNFIEGGTGQGNAFLVFLNNWICFRYSPVDPLQWPCSSSSNRWWVFCYNKDFKAVRCRHRVIATSMGMGSYLRLLFPVLRRVCRRQTIPIYFVIAWVFLTLVPSQPSLSFVYSFAAITSSTTTSRRDLLSGDRFQGVPSWVTDICVINGA